MVDYNPAVALSVKPVAPPDVIGPITSIAQLQYLGALQKKAEAEAGLAQAGLSASAETYADAKAGDDPTKLAQRFAVYNPAGATAMASAGLSDQQYQAIKQYGLANAANPLAVGGPVKVGEGAAAESNLADAAIKHVQLRGQAASSLIAAAGPTGNDPIPSTVKSYWLDNLVKEGAISSDRAKELSNHSDDELLALARGIQAQGMTPTEAASSSGISRLQTGKAAAATDLREQSPGTSIVGGAAGVAAARGVGTAPSIDSAVPAQPGGVPPAAQLGTPPVSQPTGPNYFGQTIKRESGGNPAAINKTTGASGLFQFTPATQRDLMQKHPELGLKSSDFSDASSAGVQKQLAAMRAFTADNAAALSNSGVGVNDKSLYLAHFMGAGGAAQFLKAGAQNPNAPAAQLFPAEAKANPTIFYGPGNQPRTLDQVYGVLTNGHGSGLSINVPPGEGSINMATGDVAPGTGAPTAAPQPSPAAALLAARNATGPSPAGSPVGLRTAALAPPQAPAPAPNNLSTANSAPLPTVAPQRPLIAPGSSTPAANPNVLSPAAVAPSYGAPASNPNVLVPGMSLADVAADRTRGEASARIQAEQFQDAQRGYRDAQSAQLSLQQLQKSLADVKDSTGLTNFFLAPGSGATERAGWAKEINTRLSQIGMAPMIDPSKISAAEEAQKITGRLGFDTSRTLGSREAASIVQEAIHLNPGLENSPQGAKVVAASINAAAQRQKDFYAFLSDSGNKAGSDIAFDRAHPVSQYAREAQVLAAIPQGAVDLLQKHASDPRAAALFERQYGPGMARYYVGNEQ